MNEREYLQQIAKSDPEDLMTAVVNADAQQERVLRIYLGDAQFEEVRRHAAETRETRAVATSNGNVVVLHGIMGGELSEANGLLGSMLIWVQVLNLFAGWFDHLTLNADGTSQHRVSASGTYMRYYASLLTSLSRNWKTKGFAYDWRIDMRQSADALRAFIDGTFGPDAPVNLVAHSMGGLVARSYIARHEDRWDKGGRLVMLGTPNYGAFAITKLLLGTNDVLQTLNRIDVRHNVTQLLEIARTFTGTYQMLPYRGHIDGLEVLYKAATYNVVPIQQVLLDNAIAFQEEIANAVDPARMVYVAGYRRPTPAAIRNPGSLGTDDGYVLSLKGDGTVPHDLGRMDGVATYFVDEEHMKLPANTRVQGALTELLLTGALQNEDLLYKGLGPEFDLERGAVGEDQQKLQAEEATRIATKQEQAVLLRDLLTTRAVATTDAPVSAEEMALADLMLLRDPAPAQVVAPAREAVGGAVSDKAAAAAAASGSVGAPPGSGTVAPTATPSAGAPSAAGGAPSVAARPAIRIHVVDLPIEKLARDSSGDELPIDSIAVGHYLRVNPGGSEHALDRAISGPREGDAGDDSNLLLAQFHQRGILRGDLGIPFFLPDPRPAFHGNLIVVAGLGTIGSFGVPELSLVVRDLAWSLAQLGRKHMGTVLIGSGGRNLSIADTIHAFVSGLSRALLNAATAKAPRFEAVTFSVLPAQKDATLSALWREKDQTSAAALPIDLDLRQPRPERIRSAGTKTAVEPVRISIEFAGGMCRYSAITREASIPERAYPMNPRRMADINARLLSTSDPVEKYKLGRFLLDFLVPQDLRPLLSGSAPVVLMCNNDAARVYWELAAQPLGDEELMTEPLNKAALGSPASQPYLGLQRGLTRQLRTVIAPPPEPPPPFGRVLRVLVVANPSRENPLPGAKAEAERLVELFKRINEQHGSTPNANRIEFEALIGPNDATTLDVLLRINQQPPFDVLHYAGHCVLDEKAPDRSGFLFSGDDRLTANDLDRVDRTPKFIFANACQSGVLPSRPDLINPQLPAAFAEAFFKKGVANFICTAWPVADRAASDFAFDLYSKLLGAGGDPPQPMHAALRSARATIAATPTWGAYQHYGDPDFRLFHHKT